MTIDDIMTNMAQQNTESPKQKCNNVIDELNKSKQKSIFVGSNNANNNNIMQSILVYCDKVYKHDTYYANIGLIKMMNPNGHWITLKHMMDEAMLIDDRHKSKYGVRGNLLESMTTALGSSNSLFRSFCKKYNEEMMRL